MALFQRSAVLALGGGGARGLAHIGVFRALEELQINARMVVGTSMGAVMGALHCLGMDSWTMEGHVKSFLNSKAYHHTGIERLQNRDAHSAFNFVGKRLKARFLLNMSLSRKGVFDSGRLVRAIEALVPDRTFEELTTPLVVVASDLKEGNRIVYREGSLRQALLGSSSIPGFFPPVETNGHCVLDGSVTDLVPVMPARELGGGPVIAVDVSRKILPVSGEENLFEIVQLAASVTSDTLTRLQLRFADYVVSFPPLEINWYDFHSIDELITLGYEQTLTVVRRYGPVNRILGRIKRTLHRSS